VLKVEQRIEKAEHAECSGPVLLVSLQGYLVLIATISISTVVGAVRD
jgi:hypothetical protein